MPTTTRRRPIDTEARKTEFEAVMLELRGNISAVARTLGCSRIHVHRLIKRYGFDLVGLRTQLGQPQLVEPSNQNQVLNPSMNNT